jgi:hypothetical protein
MSSLYRPGLSECPFWTNKCCEFISKTCVDHCFKCCLEKGLAHGGAKLRVKPILVFRNRFFAHVGAKLSIPEMIFWFQRRLCFCINDSAPLTLLSSISVYYSPIMNPSYSTIFLLTRLSTNMTMLSWNDPDACPALTSPARANRLDLGDFPREHTVPRRLFPVYRY